VRRPMGFVEPVGENLVREHALDGDHRKPREHAREEEQDRDVARVPEGVDLGGRREEQGAKPRLVKRGQRHAQDDGGVVIFSMIRRALTHFSHSAIAGKPRRTGRGCTGGSARRPGRAPDPYPNPFPMMG